MLFFLFIHSSFESFSPSFDRRMILRYYSEKKKPGTFNEQFRSDIPDAFGYILLVLDGTLYFGGWYSNYSIFSVPLMLHSTCTCSWSWWWDYMCTPPPTPPRKKDKKGDVPKKNNQHSSNVFRRSRTWRYNAKIQ